MRNKNLFLKEQKYQKTAQLFRQLGVFAQRFETAQA